MSPNSPHYQFDHESIGWLHRKIRAKEYVSSEDLRRIATANPDAFSDPAWQDLYLRSGSDLKKPNGRPRTDFRDRMKTLLAYFLCQQWAEEIREERRARPTRIVRGEPGAREQAAEEVARYLGMNISGRALLNKFSAQKRRCLLMMSAATPT